ncbi:MAG: DNA-binding transcriptional regulator [Bacteroidales bacterium]|nr:DNA-binding transcriptional regulator [Bacteroidales bacterium]
MNLLFITDFTEQFPYRLLRGILRYSLETEPWTVYKMPPSFKNETGLRGVISWAVEHEIDVVIAQFDPLDNVVEFGRHGIVAIAQDYVSTFNEIPNITADYDGTGALAAKRFLARGFQNFAFFGYRGVCWSDGRCRGFRNEVEKAGFGDSFHLYDKQNITNFWSYDMHAISEWLTSLPKPIAIMACDDNQANLLIQGCNACGVKVPTEVAIVGVDNDEILCSMSVPSLSSINMDIERAGYETAIMAARMVREPGFKGYDIIIRPLNIVSRMSSNVFATKDQEILRALEYIGSHVDHKISVSDVLEQVPLSRRLLEQRFMKATGTSIYQYITSLRIERFAELLLASNDSVANIAARLEEPDAKSISRRFQALKGCTPSEFRREELRKLRI